jgi:hypothetical protein
VRISWVDDEGRVDCWVGGMVQVGIEEGSLVEDFDDVDGEEERSCQLKKDRMKAARDGHVGEGRSGEDGEEVEERRDLRMERSASDWFEETQEDRIGMRCQLLV